ncbi:MAG TPA: DUF3857 domain-containing protein [Terriglobales bacterium]|nr:DUF3857 domain-containing protein [Terriglobales bacterium]
MLRKLSVLLFLFLMIAAALPAFAGDDWLPIPKEDLAMKDFAPLPGAHAVILYRKVERNDKEGWEKQYFRIKILDEEGKSNANVETDTLPSSIRFSNLEARTIHSDGSMVQFQGKPLDKLVAKYKGIRLYAKAFTLPDVQAGSIIEYRYRTSWDTNILYDSQWTVQEALATRDADFSLKYGAESGIGIAWLTFLLGNQQPKDNKGTVTLSLHNIPGLEKEQYMPPEKELRARVEFTYYEGQMKKPDEFWNDSAKTWYKNAEDYMNKKKAAQAEVATLVAPADTPEAKLRKIYDRVQKLRNLTYEREKSEKEQEREKLKDDHNIEDVLKYGYAYHNQLNRTFVALARAAGLDATLIRVVERDQYFHHKDVPKWERVSSELAIVKYGGADHFFDPGIPYCPFGLLSWEDTGTMGLLLNKEKADWQKTPEPTPMESMEKRSADLELDSDGALKGQVAVLFEGRDALYERLHHRDDDDTQRRKEMEDMFKNWLPSGSTVELAKIDDWESSTDKFTVSAKVTIPSFGAATGKRMMVPISVFPGADNHAFRHARRVYPVYFRNPYREADEITIKIPDGMQIETLPDKRHVPTPFADLDLDTAKEGNTYKVNRQVVVKGYFFPQDYYPALRGFLDQVKAVGDEQAVLRAAK